MNQHQHVQHRISIARSLHHLVSVERFHARAYSHFIVDSFLFHPLHTKSSSEQLHFGDENSRVQCVTTYYAATLIFDSGVMNGIPCPVLRFAGAKMCIVSGRVIIHTMEWCAEQSPSRNGADRPRTLPLSVREPSWLSTS